MKILLIFMVAVVFSNFTVAQVDLENGLVGYYNFDAAGEMIVENLAEGPDLMPDGEIMNEPEWVDGISGSAIRYIPSGGSWVSFGTYDPSANTEQLSVSIWMKWEGLNGGWHSVCGKRDGWDPPLIMWDICLDMNSGGIQFETNTSDVGKVFIITIETPPIEEWMYIAMTFDGEWAMLYMDGEMVVEGQMRFGEARESDFHLGCGTTGGIDPFNGALDEFRVYNRALSAEEVLALANKTAVDHNNATVISNYVLHQNYPNPFNPQTLIDYQVPQTADINISVYNTIGQLVATLVDEVKSPGQYSVSWNATDQNGLKVPSGIYFYRLQSANEVITRKMALLK